MTIVTQRIYTKTSFIVLANVSLGVKEKDQRSWCIDQPLDQYLRNYPHMKGVITDLAVCAWWTYELVSSHSCH